MTEHKYSRVELEILIARLNGQRGPLEAAYSRALWEVAKANSGGTRALVERTNAIAELARIALSKCDAQVAEAERALATLNAYDNGL